jgi:hypothetical protein
MLEKLPVIADRTSAQSAEIAEKNRNTPRASGKERGRFS